MSTAKSMCLGALRKTGCAVFSFYLKTRVCVCVCGFVVTLSFYHQFQCILDSLSRYHTQKHCEIHSNNTLKEKFTIWWELVEAVSSPHGFHSWCTYKSSCQKRICGFVLRLPAKLICGCDSLDNWTDLSEQTLHFRWVFRKLPRQLSQQWQAPPVFQPNICFVPLAYKKEEHSRQAQRHWGEKWNKSGN